MRPRKCIDPPARIALTRREASVAIPMCLRALDQAIADGKLPVFRLGKSVRIPVDSLNKYISSLTTGGSK